MLTGAWWVWNMPALAAAAALLALAGWALRLALVRCPACSGRGRWQQTVPCRVTFCPALTHVRFWTCATCGGSGRRAAKPEPMR